VAKKTSSKATSTRKTSTPDAKDTPEDSLDNAQSGPDTTPHPGGAARDSDRPPADKAAEAAEPEPDAPGAGNADRLETNASEDSEARADTDGPDTDSPADDEAGAARDDAAQSPVEEQTADGDDADETSRDEGVQQAGPGAARSAPAVTEQVTVRKGGFAPMVLGGVLAGATGFGAAYYLMSQREVEVTAAVETLRSETEQALADQSDQISALSDAVDAAEPPDLSGLRQAQSELQDTVAALSDRLDGTQETLTSIRERLTALEKRPVAEGASDEAIAAYEAELKALQDAMAAQRAEIEKMTAEAREMEENAEATAQATRRRAALSRIATALDTGSAFADAVAELESTGIEMPEGLSRTAGEGVATLAELEESFPAAARAALAAARDAAIEAGETGGLTDFLRTQLGVRSLEPRAGNDPDAILSRAEAAVREGRLHDALTEIGTLPEVARAELTDWTARATRRLDALAAVRDLSEQLN